VIITILFYKQVLLQMENSDTTTSLFLSFLVKQPKLIRFICLVSHSTDALYFLIQETVIWIPMDRTLLIMWHLSGSDWGLSGGMKTEECLSKNGIRSRSLLGSLNFGIFIDVPLIYDIFGCSFSFIDLCSSWAEVRFY
jgi:hypothetical protein